MAQATVLELKGARKVERAITKVVKQIRIEIQQGMAEYIERVRVRAAREGIIENTQKDKKTVRAMRQAQPVHPTKLTSRTGRLKKMLLSEADPKGVKKNWSGFGRIMAKHQAKGMSMNVKSDVSGRNTVKETYSGRLYGDSNKIGSGMTGKYKGVTDTKKTLVMRFRWETGIRGSRREFIRPAAIKEELNLNSLFNKRLARIKRKWDT